MFDFFFGNIGNVNETPMYFNMLGNNTIDRVGSKTITVKTTHKNQHFTAVSACQTDGLKHYSIVIFKRKTMAKESFP